MSATFPLFLFFIFFKRNYPDVDIMHNAIKPTNHSAKSRQSPGEIKRREVSWTLKRKFDTFAGPGEISRREVELDPQVSPEEIMSRDVELGSESWTSFTSSCYSTSVQRTLSW